MRLCLPELLPCEPPPCSLITTAGGSAERHVLWIFSLTALKMESFEGTDLESRCGTRGFLVTGLDLKLIKERRCCRNPVRGEPGISAVNTLTARASFSLPSPDQNRLAECEEQAKAAKKGMWSEGTGSHTVRDLKYTIENPRHFVDSHHQKPVNGEAGRQRLTELGVIASCLLSKLLVYETYSTPLVSKGNR